MAKVLKRSGKKVAFSQAKLKRAIDKAAKDAKITPKKRKEVIKEVSAPVIKAVKKKRVIKAVDLKRMILRKLDKVAKKAATAWRRYDKKKKKR